MTGTIGTVRRSRSERGRRPTTVTRRRRLAAALLYTAALGASAGVAAYWTLRQLNPRGG